MTREMTIADLSVIRRMADKVFGLDFHPDEHLIPFIENDKSLALVAERNNEIAGYLLARPYDKFSFLKKILHADPGVELPEKFYYLDTVLVDDNMQKQGVGSELMNAFHLNAPTSESIITLGWKNTLGVNVRKLFLAHGYQEYNEIKNLWAEDCHAGKFECPFKTSPCSCAVVFFIRTPSEQS